MTRPVTARAGAGQVVTPQPATERTGGGGTPGEKSIREGIRRSGRGALLASLPSSPPPPSASPSLLRISLPLPRHRGGEKYGEEGEKGHRGKRGEMGERGEKREVAAPAAPIDALAPALRPSCRTASCGTLSTGPLYDPWGEGL